MCRTIAEGQRICPCRSNRDSVTHNQQRRDARAARRRAARWVGQHRGKDARNSVMAAPPGDLADLTRSYGIPAHVWRVPPVRKAHLGNLESWGFSRNNIPVAAIPLDRDIIENNADDAQRWRATLDWDELDAVRYYTDTGHYDMNSSLTRGIDERHIAYVGALDAALAKAAYRHDAQTYYRGVTCPPDTLALNGGSPARWMERTYPIGATVDVSGYMSTTTQRTVAAAFSGSDGIIFEVRTREGAHLGELSAVGGSEAEVLLPRGIRWRVIAHRSPSQSPHGKPTVYMVPDDEVPYETDGTAPGFAFDDEPPF